MTPRTRTDWVILHCSATEDGPADNWEGVRRYHTTPEDQGGPAGGPWDDVGYHFGIELVGDLYVVRKGRPLEMVGSHCKAAGRNVDSIGVCVVGDFDEIAPLFKLQAITAGFLASLCLLYGLPPERVKGHREFESGKTCPGAKWNLEITRELVRMKLHRSREIEEPHLRALAYAGL